MNILYLPLKKEWYEMIERNEKKEEYREVSAYWIQRIMEWYYEVSEYEYTSEAITKKEAEELAENGLRYSMAFVKKFDAVRFSFGYTKRRMAFECKGITIGRGRKEWGAPDHETFIIKLGNRLNDERLQ